MRSFAARSTLVLLLVYVVAGGTPTGATALDRAVEDRPDEQLGPQVHVVYVTSADGPDRSFDTSGQIATSVSTWNNWLASARGRRRVADRHRSDGEPDISFLRLGRTGQQVIDSDPYYSIVGELQASRLQRSFEGVRRLLRRRVCCGDAGACGFGSPPVAITYLGERNWLG